MEIIGWIAIVALVLVVVLALIWALRSLPDVRRYLRLRRM